MTLYKIKYDNNHEGFFLKQKGKIHLYTVVLDFPSQNYAWSEERFTVESSTMNKRMALESKRYAFEYQLYHALAGWQ